MAFDLTLTKTEESKDAKTFTLDDSTGGGTNGWGGAGNPTYTINYSTLTFTMPDGSEPIRYQQGLQASQDFANPAMSVTLDIDSELLGLTESGDDITTLRSGLWNIRYAIMNSNFGVSTPLGVTNGSKTVTTSNTDFTVLFSSALYYAIEIDQEIYYIDKAAGMSALSLQLTEPFRGETNPANTNGQRTVFVDEPIILQQDIINRVQCALSKMDECGCCGKSALYLKYYAMILGMQAKVACNDLQGASDIIEFLYQELDTKGPCGC